MENKRNIFIGLAVVVVLGGIVFFYQANNSGNNVKNLSSEELKIALETAIQDEYKAQETYKKTIEKFGQVRPFSNIVNAEAKHIQALTQLFDKYYLEVPANEWAEKVTVAESVQAACAVGVQAEIENVKLYKEKLLPRVEGYPDISNVFENLMRASEQNHLVAFSRCD